MEGNEKYYVVFVMRGSKIFVFLRDQSGKSLCNQTFVCHQVARNSKAALFPICAFLSVSPKNFALFANVPVIEIDILYYT